MKPRRYLYGRGRNAAALVLLLCLCLTSLFLLLLHGSSPSLEAAAIGGEEQQEVVVQAEVEEAPLPPGNSRVAFLFIARNRLPLDLVWDAFFRDDKEGRFSIFVHSRPGFVLTRATTRSRFFYNRQVNNSIQVDWGEASMIEAERILLGHALKDPFNERFVFLSDSCVPLYNFSYTYDYIMSSSTSFVDSFADTKHGRYNPRMHPIIPVENWRKGSQWAVLIKKHAEVVVDDDVVLPEFQKHCRRRPLPEFWRDWDRPIPAEAWKAHNCIPDEHYVQTLLAQNGLEEELTQRSVTHSAWDLSSSKDRERLGWHPVTYKVSDATPALIKSIKDIDNIYYETEYRKEWCTSNEKPAPCFLFARKFTRAAGLKLLNSIASVNAGPFQRSNIIKRVVDMASDLSHRYGTVMHAALGMKKPSNPSMTMTLLIDGIVLVCEVLGKEETGNVRTPWSEKGWCDCGSWLSLFIVQAFVLSFANRPSELQPSVYI